MKIPYLISAGVMTMLTVACGYGIKTATDYDHNVKFSNYHSFFMMKGNSSGNPLLDQARGGRRQEARSRRKAWMELPEGQGQNSGGGPRPRTKTKHTYETLYDGLGAGGAGAVAGAVASAVASAALRPTSTTTRSARWWSTSSTPRPKKPFWHGQCQRRPVRQRQSPTRRPLRPRSTRCSNPSPRLLPLAKGHWT